MAMNQKERFYAQMRKEGKLLSESYPYVMAMLKACDQEGNKMFDGAEISDGEVFFKWQGREMSVNWLDCEPEEVESFIAFLDSVKQHSRDILKNGEQKTEEAAVFDAIDQIIKESYESADEMSEKYSLYGKGFGFVSGITRDYEAPDVNVKEFFTKLLNSAHNASASPIKEDDFEKLAQYYAVRREIARDMPEFKSDKKEYISKNGQITDKYAVQRIESSIRKMEQNIRRAIDLATDLNRADTKFVLSDGDYQRYFQAKAKFEAEFAGKSAEEIEELKYRSNDWQVMNRLQPHIKKTESFKNLIDERRLVVEEYSQISTEIEPISSDLWSKVQKIKKEEESAEKNGNNLDALFSASKEKTAEASKKSATSKNGNNLDLMFNTSSKRGKEMSGSQKGTE